MRDLFRAFERRRVDALVVGGQAAIFYGAAYYTQDLDLWIRPTSETVDRFLKALGDLKARVHKLTPPMTPRFVRRGHAFHFILPQRGSSPVYLDVMGRPPRVGTFEGARRRAVRGRVAGVVMPFVAIEDLVEMKKTNRPGDYEVISSLAKIRLAQASRPSAALVRWALDHCFRSEDYSAILAAHGLRRQGGLDRRLEKRMAILMARGRRYWLPLIHELKGLRRRGLLWPEGSIVG